MKIKIQAGKKLKGGKICYANTKHEKVEATLLMQIDFKKKEYD